MQLIGGVIKRVRVQRGLTQRQLGERLGVPDSTVRRYENGRANPKYETACKIAKALDVSLQAICNMEE